jgi:hypothetical protein
MSSSVDPTAVREKMIITPRRRGLRFMLSGDKTKTAQEIGKVTW